MTDVIKKNGVTFGIILGAYLVLRTAVMYSIDLKLFVNAWVGISDFIIVIILGIIATSTAKKALGGFMNFKQAFTAFFLTAVIGLAIYSIFNILLFNVIDVEAKETVKQYVLEYTVNMMQKLGNTNTEAFKTVIEDLKNTDSLSVAKQLQGLVFSIVVYSIIGLIVALIFKSKAKETY